MREHTVRGIFRQIAAGVAFLHANNLCHRDIKMENCVVTKDGTVKLVDFGLGAKTDSNVCSTVCGSPEYMAPELVCAIGSDGLAKKIRYSGKPVDVWALGILLYGLITGGRFPFTSSTMKGIFHNIRRRQVDMPPDATSHCRSLITSMLQRDPSARVTVEQVLQHPFLQQEAPAAGGGGGAVHPNAAAGRRHNRQLNMGMR